MENLEVYYAQIKDLEDRINQLKKDKEDLEKDIISFYEEDFNEVLSKKPEPYGVSRIYIGNYSLEYTRPKVVSYDQDKMAKLWQRIEAYEDPSKYINIKYDVSEAKYKLFNDKIKVAFDDARTVKPGKIKIKIGESK